MYEIIPPKSNKTAENTSAVLLIISLVAMFFSKLPNLPYRWAMQLASIAMLAVALMLLGRFVFKRYQYLVTVNDVGKYDLVINEITKRSTITVCRIALSGIETTHIVSSSDKSAKDDVRKRRAGRKVFNYCVDMSPAKYCALFAEECGEKLLIKISYDKTLLELLGSKEV